MKIGFLWPADGLNEAEYLNFLPDRLSFHVQRFDAGTETENLVPEVLSAYADPTNLALAASKLSQIKPDIFASGDHAACIIAGLDGECAMAQAVYEATNTSCMTIGKAIIDALTFLNAERISVFSPYTEDITSQLIKSLKLSGFSVVGQISKSADIEEEIGGKAPEYWWLPLIELIELSVIKPDAILIAGGGVSFASLIERFEAETGVPVVTAPGALIRSTVKQLGLKTSKQGLGRLFRARSTNAMERIASLQSSGTKTFTLSDKPPVFVAGSGVHLIDESGRAFIDFASGSGTSALGHGHPAIQSAINSQINSGITHLGPHFHAPIQANLYNQLAKLLPERLSRFHPAVSGSEATEVAIKAAMHATGNKKFISFSGGYHGRTFGALSISGAKGKNDTLGPFKPETLILPFPLSLDLGQQAANKITSDLAGVIIEPIQATGGLNKANFEALSTLAAAARAKCVPLIFDEVFTGFGRTGSLFAFSHYKLVPDLLIMGKSFGGGMPAGLLAGTDEILGNWSRGVQTSTFQLHPVAAATSNAFLKVFCEQNILENCKLVENWCRQEFSSLENKPHVLELKGIGAFWVLEIDDPGRAKLFRQKALNNGLLTWECGVEGKGIGLVPPLTVKHHHIKKAKKILELAFAT